MAYNKEKLYNQAIDAIKSNNLFFIEDVVAWLPCSKQTFYDYFPIDSDEMDNIKTALENNKIKTKSSIRSKLYKGKGAELIALYKILATKEELQALNGQYHDHTTKGDKFEKISINTLNPDGAQILIDKLNDEE